MPGPQPKYHIQLTTVEEQTLRRVVKAHNSSQSHVLRATNQWC
jgi:hypothetical protein